MVGVVPHPEQAPDDLAHTAGGPQICRIAVDGRSLLQGPEQPHLLPGGELGRAPRHRLGGQAGGALLAHRLPPQMHRTHRTAQAPRHRRQGETGLEQLEGPAAAALQLLGAAMRSHAARIAQGGPLFYYLCVIQ